MGFAELSKRHLTGRGPDPRSHQDVEPGLAIRFLGLFQWENEHSTSFVLSDILDYKAPPSLPEDRSSKKVKMPRAKKIVAKDIEDMTEEELLERLEDESLGDGMSSVNDEEPEDYGVG
jgi:hypothetical protein